MRLLSVPDGRACPCGKRGCWERYCSGTARGATALEMLSGGDVPGPSGLAREAAVDPGRVTGKRVAAAAREGDPVARAAVDDMGRWLGEGLSLVADVFDPDLVVIAGGVEMMSRVAMGSDGAAIAADPSLAMASHFVPQGISADLIATRYGFSRDEADALAVESQRRAAQAWAEGRFARSVVPVTDINGLTLLDHDEALRPGTDMAALSQLKPAFREMGEAMPGFDAVALMKYPDLERIHHIHHAGNSSGIVDGAAAVLVGSRAFGEAHGLRPRARIRATAKIGTDPTLMLTGPVPVTEKILREAGMTVRDIDLFEVNEAFSAVVLRFLQAFAVDPARVNVNGGAIAMGHPLGATGAMLIGTLLDELERTGQQTGLVTLCVASGMGAATILERV